LAIVCMTYNFVFYIVYKRFYDESPALLANLVASPEQGLPAGVRKGIFRCSKRPVSLAISQRDWKCSRIDAIRPGSPDPCFLELYEYEACILMESTDSAVSPDCFECLPTPHQNLQKEIAAQCFHRLTIWHEKRRDCITRADLSMNLAVISTRISLVAETIVARSFQRMQFSGWIRTLMYKHASAKLWSTSIRWQIRK
jgi:hypothetical protein